MEQTGPIPSHNEPGHHPEVEQDKPVGPPPEPQRIQRSHRFEFAFDPVMAPAAALVGVTPWTSGVEVDAERLHVRFGPWSLRAPIDDIAGAEPTGPYRLLKVAGPPRLSLVDRGVTFATNRRAGVCIRFRHPVRAIDPWGLLRHTAATVTVADVDRLARLLDPG
jgi:hypothetical protein